MRLSASRLDKWKECPLKAKFHYVDGLVEPTNAYMTFGTCTHYGMQVYNETLDVEQAVEAFRDAWTNPEKLDAVPEIWPKGTDFQRMMKQGVEAIQAFDEEFRFVNRTVLAVEHPFLVPLGRHTLTGYVDCLQVADGRKGQVLECVDYKTARKRPNLGALRLDLQFTCYDFATRRPEFWLGNPKDPEKYPPMENGEFFWQMHRDLPRKNTWYGLIQGKAFDAGPRDQADFLRMYRLVNEIEKALEHNVFVPNISGDSCIYCPYGEPCGLPIDDVRSYSEIEEDDLR